MLHRVGHVHGAPLDASLRERLVQDPPRGPHERVPFAILGVAGLLAHEHEPGARRALPENRLRGVRPERTVPAGLGRPAQRF